MLPVWYWPLIYVLTATVETYFFYDLLTHRIAPRSKNPAVNFGIYVGLVLCTWAINMIGLTYTNLFILPVMYFVFGLLIAGRRFNSSESGSGWQKGSLQQIIISVVLFYIIFAAVEAAFEAIYHVQEIKDSLGINPSRQFTYLIIVTFAKTVSLVIVKIINRFGTTNTTRMPLPQFLGFLLLPLASFIVLGMLVSSARADRLSHAEEFWIVAGCLGLLISNLVIFYLFDRTMEAMERNREYEVARLQYEYESRELRRLSEYNERNRKLHHDLEHYLSTISALSSQRDFEGIGRVIHSVDGRIKDAKQQIYCQNSIVNSVFSLKHEEAERLGIDFRVEVVPVMELSHIDDGDMCVLLSNVLSNAVEAAAKCEGDRFVDVGVFPVAENKAIVIRVCNSYTGKLNTDSDGRLISSKKNRSRHGFGLTNVGEVVDKYSGTYYYETAETDKVFITHIMLNML